MRLGMLTAGERWLYPGRVFFACGGLKINCCGLFSAVLWWREIVSALAHNGVEGCAENVLLDRRSPVLPAPENLGLRNG